ncbi:MAG: hypothetical protein ACRDQY_14185 [Pseudonocardiaceae bacterium]
MRTYDRLQHATRNGTARQVIPQWASNVLGDIARNTLKVTGVRHPLGFLCLPVERTGEDGICLHVWNDSLAQMSPTTSTIHAHSWDLTSYVLYGSVRNNVFNVTDAPDDAAYRVFEVHSGADIDEIHETPRLVRCQIRTTELSHGGDTYALTAGIFHATVVQGAAATVALGRSRAGTLDLSLGGINRTSHRVQRQRCAHEETAQVVQLVTKQLGTVDRGDP